MLETNDIMKYIISIKTGLVSLISGRMVLPSKLVDGRHRVQSPVAQVDLAIQNFPCFLRNSHKYGRGSLKKTPTKSTPPIGLGPS